MPEEEQQSVGRCKVTSWSKELRSLEVSVLGLLATATLPLPLLLSSVLSFHGISLGHLKYFSCWSFVMGGGIVWLDFFPFFFCFSLLSSPKLLLCGLSRNLVQGGNRGKNTSW